MSKTKTAAPVTVEAWIEQQLAQDAALRQAVEEELNQMRVEQDLAALRERHGLSQGQLARALGVSQPAIAKLEAGTAKNLGIRTIVRHAMALGARVKITIEPDPRAQPVAKGTVLGLVPRRKKAASA